MPFETPGLPGDSSRDHTAYTATARGGFRVAHLMLLVAATAIGIVGTRNCDSQMRFFQIDRRNLVNWFILASPLLMSVSLALIIARLLPPRPCLSETFRQPGFAANWVTALFMGLNTLQMCSMNPDKFSSIGNFINMFSFVYYWSTVSQSGGGVLVAWLSLALTGCWRAEPSWIDRSGRVLGAVYVAAFLANHFATLLWLR